MNRTHKKGSKNYEKKERLINDKHLERSVSSEVAREFLETNKEKQKNNGNK